MLRRTIEEHPKRKPPEAPPGNKPLKACRLELLSVFLNAAIVKQTAVLVKKTALMIRIRSLAVLDGFSHGVVPVGVGRVANGGME
jgi:hypothetical protein